jgi:NADPH-dependent curcumin reductase CurA
VIAARQRGTRLAAVTECEAAATTLPYNFEFVLDRFLTIQSFRFMDSLDRYDQFVADMLRWRGEGRMHLEETVYEGLDQAPHALCALLNGKHIGKPLVRLAT